MPGLIGAGSSAVRSLASVPALASGYRWLTEPEHGKGAGFLRGQTERFVDKPEPGGGGGGPRLDACEGA